MEIDILDQSKEQAYNLNNSEEHKIFYNRWARTYDDDFAKNNNYIYPSEVAKVFKSTVDADVKSVADIGCGTGLVGLNFKNTSFSLDGFDISEGMLEVAREKSVYNRLIALDLEKLHDYPKIRYDGILSSGTFTLGHLGPKVLLKTLLLASYRAQCVIGVNHKHFVAEGFVDLLKYLVSKGIITQPRVTNVPIYSQTKNKADINIGKLLVFKVCKQLTTRSVISAGEGY